MRIEFIGWLRRGLRLCARRKTFTRRIESVLADTRPMFLLPLQLDRDAQIRFHSPFTNMTALIEHVIGSFVRFAPSVARLVIKNHPLDNGVTDYSRIIARAAAKEGAADRIVFIEGGHLPSLLKRATGAVVVNSTAGLQAIHHRCPTKALGPAVYALPGLVDTAPLDAFWRDPKPPSVRLYRAFRALLIARCQLNGSFFTRAGRIMLLQDVVRRLTEESNGTITKSSEDERQGHELTYASCAVTLWVARQPANNDNCPTRDNPQESIT